LNRSTAITIKVDYKTWVFADISPSIEASILSPLIKGPTPEGVPVNMMSPGNNVKMAEI
jgi:hypothetical protein